MVDPNRSGHCTSSRSAGFSVRGVRVVEGVETRIDARASLHPSITILPIARPRDPARVLLELDLPRPASGYGVHNNSLNNLLRGLNERVFYRDSKRTLATKPEPRGFRKLAAFDRIKGFKVRAWSLDEVVASYSGSQALRYGRAAEEVRAYGLTKRDAKVSTFVKAEKINFAAKHDPAPRVIQPRDPKFNVVIAKYIKPMEHLIYKWLGKLYKYPCVAKGFNAYQTGEIFASKWALFDNPCAVSLDASRFDQHVSVDALKWTHSIYRKFNNDPEFVRLLKMMYKNRGIATCKDGFVKYEVEGCRMSGDMDTALGNCLLMVAMTWALTKSLGIRSEVMDNGDDCTVILDTVDVERFRSAVPGWYKSLGFDMKVEDTVYALEHIEFCQTHPVYDGERWRMVRNLPCLAKDLVSVITPTSLRAWWRAIGECGLALTDGLPIMGAFYKFLVRAGTDPKGVKNHRAWRCGMVNLAKGMVYEDRPITTAARVSFACAFGIGPEMQGHLERMYDSIDPLVHEGPGKYNVLTEHELNSPELFEQRIADYKACSYGKQTQEFTKSNGFITNPGHPSDGPSALEAG